MKKIKSIYVKRGKYSLKLYKEMRKELTDKMNIIKMFPKAYPILSNSDFRKIPIDKYIILYSFNKNIINIKDIIHQRSKYFNNQD